MVSKLGVRDAAAQNNGKCYGQCAYRRTGGLGCSDPATGYTRQQIVDPALLISSEKGIHIHAACQVQGAVAKLERGTRSAPPVGLDRCPPP